MHFFFSASPFGLVAILFVPGLGLVRAQEAPQQIITGFSTGPDIKGTRREEGIAEEQRHRTVNTGINVSGVRAGHGSIQNKLC